MRSMTAIRHTPAILLLLTLAACGDEPVPTPELPREADAALTWTRAAEEIGPAELDRRLALWDAEAEHLTGTQETQIVATWRMQRAVASGDLANAKGNHQVLVHQFDGTARTPQGRVLKARLVRMGLATGGLKAAMAAMEGPTPDRAQADQALRHVHDWDADTPELEEVRRWVRLDRLADLGLKLPTHQGPRVVVVATHFALGEVVLPQVLKRWQRDLGSLGLQVTVVPYVTGQVRVGMRTVPARDPQTELATIRRTITSLGLTAATSVDTEALQRTMPTDIGVDTGIADYSAVFVVSRAGRIVARISGRTVDPQSLNDVVHRIASR